MSKQGTNSTEYLKIAAPAVLAIILFLVAVFGLFVPTYRQTMINDKKEMIHQLIHTAWCLLGEMEQKVRNGEMSREEAQRKAIEQIRGLRYGDEYKDYFWINDMRPYMIMHPYRPDLDGKDLSDFKDPHGVPLFVKAVEAVKGQGGEGFVSYMWQWKDNPDIIVPKLSFVKEFKPWGWIIGTGIYIEDVRQEISKITKHLIFISLGILAVISALTATLVIQTLNASRLRKIAEKELLEYQNNLEELIEERTADLLKAHSSLSSEITERQKAEKEKERLIPELRKALDDIKELQSIVPICTYCKQIRDDSGYWNQLEKYLSEHPDVEFTNAICPKCMAERYPDKVKDD